MTRTILITGCSSGIGRDAALKLSRLGWGVVASARSAADVDRLRGDGLKTVRLDYADEASIAEGFEEALGITGGRLDALFNNGAHALPGPLEDIPSAGLRAQLEANVIGWHDLTRRAIPVMRAQGYGRIVQNSSVLGLVGVKWRGAYVATKFAIEGYSDVLRQELAGSGIHVILIEPGPIATKMRENAIRQFERWVDWESSARAEEYRAGLLEKLYKGSAGKTQHPPAAVTRVLVRALEARRPAARYPVTPNTTAAMALRRLLPARLLDRLLSRA
ncbi:SDR family NAD(P)-dependent oxidoreductase [Histidinibacterium lentulum]|uniref:SDR family NAD(P)-dependent oxidoreductase n=1 Tax=Histidinibacterium lentulum TaxID=2480588 RepID=A0A3N2R5B3_9RHOB|nr:SDR family NAD(P)-dependent oxidoreductase [Histidinibacterium lentulum]ROU02682.1 SDR family NAD(P)-dependent oxidoreductase [Histidinibacterium lentulum]